MFANKVSDVATVVEAKDEAMAMVMWVEQQEELLLQEEMEVEKGVL